MHVRKWTQGITLKTTGIGALALLAALMSLTRRIACYGLGLDTSTPTGRMQ